MNPLETYLREMADIRATGAGVAETSYYGPLRNLLNDIGKTLKPKIQCVINLQNQGAGLPDGGFFTADQIQTPHEGLLKGQTPARGVIEIKPTSDDAWVTAGGRQVSKYWERYGLVLVTNYRDFLLLGRDEEGKPASFGAFRLAESEREFWASANHPQKAAKEHGERFVEYLKRVMLHAAPLAEPRDVAWFLASYAREARFRVEAVDLPALTAIRAALEDALGLKFEGEKGEHFFRSTLIQTLFYGVFSAWVLWSKKRGVEQGGDHFDWKMASWSLHVPMIRALFEQVATPSKLGPLGLVETLDWTAAVLNRVDRAAFFATFEEGHAVQYFYEPFLEAFDPDLRKELGVWYTPPEIVQYMVARVDTVLREELQVADGLADPNVYVLDPCCGTGAYLVEVLRRIDATLRAKGQDALAAQDLKRAAMERVFGFEILPAPLVVSHLQLGLLLHNLGAPLSEKASERAAVYLTNALTGWEPPKDPKKRLTFPELEQEREAAEEIKRDKPILVILGNPPYNAYAGVSPTEEHGLVEPYKEGLISVWGIKKFNLDDLYVRFFRLAERRIAEMTGKGVVCFISNFSYLRDPSFAVMRERFLGEFNEIWLDCLNGDSRETGKKTPDGKPDPSVFSAEYHPVGIRVGTAVGLFVKKGRSKGQCRVRHRDFWGVTKRADLLRSVSMKRHRPAYVVVQPRRENRFSFRPALVSSRYLEWPRIIDLCAEPPSNGLMEKRGGALIDIDRSELQQRMGMYFDKSADWDELKALGSGLTEVAAGFDPKAVRKMALASEHFQADRMVRYSVRPFDVRWCYYSGVSGLWNRARPSLWALYRGGNFFIVTRPAGVASPEGVPFFFTRALGDNDSLRGHAYYFPTDIPEVKRKRNGGKKRFENNHALDLKDTGKTKAAANLSTEARAYLAHAGVKALDSAEESKELAWLHALAIGHSALYLKENADGIRQDWPRIPLPLTAKALRASADLGRQVAAMLDTEHTVKGVTSGQIRAELKPVAIISRAGGGALKPDRGDLSLTAGWGHAGKEGATMPGKGRIERRDYSAEEKTAIADGVKALGLTRSTAMEQLGDSALDVYLNEVAYWKCMPTRVWEYTIGGYQVIKKWLSYREHDLLGRSLTQEEAREVMNMARRIAALLLLGPTLDKNYAAVRESCYSWPKSHTGTGGRRTMAG